jgi:hypothetical protein
MSSFLQDADSSRTSSIITESAAASRTSTHNKGKKIFVIWAHIRKSLKYEDQELLYYFYCKFDDKPHDVKITSSIIKHIRSMHKTVQIEKILNKNQEIVRQQLKSIYYQAAATENTEELDMKILKKFINQNVFIETLIILIVIHNLSFCVIEWPAFHIFYQILQGALSHIHIFLDIWISSNR